MALLPFPWEPTFEKCRISPSLIPQDWVEATTRQKSVADDVAAFRRLPEPLLTIEEVAEWLQISVNTIYAWRVKDGGPKAVRIGKYLRWQRRDVQGWIDSQAS